MTDRTDVLMFVEDPGAANFIAPLPAVLAERGWHATVFAAGLAKNYLEDRRVDIQVVDPSMTAEQILSTINPRILIAGTAENKDTFGLTLISAARASGIITIGIIDSVMNAHYRFRGQSDAPLTYAPDWLLVPDEWTKQAFMALGFPETDTVVCGHPHYDYVMDMAKRFKQVSRDDFRRRLLPGVKDGQKAVVFVTEGSARVKRFSRLPIHECTFSGRGKNTGRTEIMLEEFLDAVQSIVPRPYLILRLHPKDEPGDYSLYLDEFDQIDSSGSPLELIYAADLVVGITSMLLMEGALLGIPTLSILPSLKEKELSASIRTGITPYITTREELKSEFGKLLQKDILPTLHRNDSFIYHGALQRITEFIEKLLIKE